MADLTLRSIKGTRLTNDEVDANFVALNDDVASLSSRGGLGEMTAVTDATHAASVGEVCALLSEDACVVTAPSDPQPGDTFVVVVANGLLTNEIDWDGAKHQGIDDATMTIDAPSPRVTLQYIDADYGWKVSA